MFLNYIHNFRAIAILFIVAAHCSWAVPSCAEQRVFFRDAAEIILMNGTVLFIFIAGFLFQYLSSSFSYTMYLSKKLKFVILPYILFSLPAIAVKVSSAGDVQLLHPALNEYAIPFIWSNTALLYYFKQIGWYLISGDSLTPFWFIPMMAILYIIAPILIRLDRGEKIYWLLPAFVIISVIVPRPYNTVQISQSLPHFFSVYLFGMFCCRYRDILLEKMQTYWVWCLLGVVGMIQLEMFFPTMQLGYSPFNYLQKMFLSVLLLYWLWQADAHIHPRVRSSANVLADLSFGIYFVHYYFVYGVREFSFFSHLLSHSFLSLLALTFFITALSVFILQAGRLLLKNRSRVFLGC
jgi:surface polysaccharide O-acyltransferase-like enzyme